MDLLPYVATVFSDNDLPVSEITTTVAPLMDTAENTTTLAADFADKFLNMDFIHETFTSYAQVFAIGFAFATLLILITFGVFKAFSLVRIDS